MLSFLIKTLNSKNAFFLNKNTESYKRTIKTYIVYKYENPQLLYDVLHYTTLNLKLNYVHGPTLHRPMAHPVVFRYLSYSTMFAEHDNHQPGWDMFVLVCSLDAPYHPNGWPHDHGPTNVEAIVKKTTAHYITLRYTTLHYTALHFSAQYCSAAKRSAVHCSAMRCSAVQCCVLQYSAV